MKQNMQALSLSMLCLYGCAGAYTVTDNVRLYPANKAAEQWGMLQFYVQYQSNSLPTKLDIELPNNKQLSGQLTYLENSVTAVEDDGWSNDVNIGVGYGFHRSYWGGSWSPRVSTYRSHISKVSINAFGAQLGLNCSGEFNRKQQTGTVDCTLTNGMAYRGTLNRVTAK